MKSLVNTVAALCLVSLMLPTQRTVAALVNGNLDSPLTPPGWSLVESVSGSPDLSADVTDFLGHGLDGPALWLKAFAGHTALPLVGQNKSVNAILSQSVAAMPGETYTFSGYSIWEQNYAGGVATLDAGSPSGAAPSPTETTFEIAFLDMSNAVLGSPAVLDLRSVQVNDNTWRQHAVSDTAPAGTVSVRVTAAATNMVHNVDPGQSAFFDSFSLSGASAAATELLTNGGLNDPPFIPGWNLVETPSDVDTAAVVPFFAAHSSARGLWLRSFAEGDAVLSQTLPAEEGLLYTFSGWSKWEGGYSGGVETLDPLSPHGAIPSPTETIMELAFLDGSSSVIGTPISLDLRTVQANDNTWRQHALSGVAPDGTVNIRVTAAAYDMRANVDVGGALGNQSAFFDDFTLAVVPEPANLAAMLLGLAVLIANRPRMRRSGC